MNRKFGWITTSDYEKDWCVDFALLFFSKLVGSLISVGMDSDLLMVLSPKSNGDLRFRRVNAPTSKELNALVATISERVERYLERHG